MLKFLAGVIFLILTTLLPPISIAATNSYVSVVNPIRGSDFWDLKDQKIETAVFGEMDLLKKYNLPATWLLRFDALRDKGITEKLIKSTDEKGLFLEVTPTWTTDAKVDYHKSDSWHSAGSAFLTGYEIGDREKLIDSSFEKFKSVFGYYPTSVGAWWIDSHSLGYMQSKYKITGALIVSDQYSTDNYQIWGQYFSTPYYPSKNNALHPASSLENKLDLVITQWAPRDPVNSYGNGVEESTFSVQPNDYIDYHDLNVKYFSSLIDLYGSQKFNQFSHLVVGLENSYSWNKYESEYDKQLSVLSEKIKSNQLKVITLKHFSDFYKSNFTELSPTHLIISDDPLGSLKKTIWFMNPYYRVGYFVNNDGSVFRDIRQYIDGEEELCLQKRCDSVNFATSATRVLDDVSFGHKWIIDSGRISDFKIDKKGDSFVLIYKNEAGNLRTIEFLPRDISIDGKVYSIDGIILEATKHNLDKVSDESPLPVGSFKWSPPSVFFKIIKFLGFLIFGCLIPGVFLINKVKDFPLMQKLSLGLVLGFVLITLIFFLLNLAHFKQGIYIYLLLNLLLLVKFRKELSKDFTIKFRNKFELLLTVLIGVGTLFQQMPTFKNGLSFPYGFGFWGPNTHDGIWHISLINQLMNKVPPQNPSFAGVELKNYHYFYDLLVALTNFITDIPILDLVFRFYPIIFSLILGISSYYLIKLITTSPKAILFSIYLMYFAGSFGWIVEYIKQGHLGGESAFWANQSISFNLNPPFAISLLIVIAILQLLTSLRTKTSILSLIILSGSLISFKAYGAVIILLTLFLIGILKKDGKYLLIFLGSFIISVLLFISNFTIGQSLIIFSPFWFIHSMIDSPDRVGWTRLTLARIVGLETGNWFKFISSEAISLTLFIIGNLGIRFFALFSLVKIKEIFKDKFKLTLFIVSFLSLIIPIIVIQAGNPWNTIQFIYYFLYISALVGGIILARMPLIIVVFFLIITPINSWATANSYLSYQPHARISLEEATGLNFLASQDSGVILTYPYDGKLKTRLSEPWPIFAYDSTAYVSAFSKKVTYLEDLSQQNILLTDYKKRQVASNDFFTSSDSQKQEFLKKFKIKYIYIPKIFNQRIAESSIIKNIFENEEIIIYGVNK